jgi:hypothetical protein
MSWKMPSDPSSVMTAIVFAAELMLLTIPVRA